MNPIESKSDGSEDAARSSGAPGNVSRRAAVLAAGGTLGALMASGLASAAEDAAHEHANHAEPDADLLQAASDCSLTAQLCLTHCLESFLEGDTSLAACARSIVAMMPLCDAFVVQVANYTDYVDGLAGVCRAACVDCEKECRKHARHHAICRESADACAHLIAMIDGM